MHACAALLDNGSPASFIPKKAWTHMLACGAATRNDIVQGSDENWGGFHGTPVQ